jgi:hypothetical protein
MLTILYLFCAACSLALAALGLRRLISAPTLVLACVLPTIFAILYDNLVLGLGHFIGPGQLLINLNWMRFLLHVFSLPAPVLAMALLARGAGVRWASHRLAIGIAIGATLATLVVGFISELLLLNLAPQQRGEILIYTHAHVSGPPPGVVIFLLATLIYGAAIGLRARWPWLLLSGIYMILVQISPDPGLRGALVNTGEVLLLGSLVVAAQRFVPPPQPLPHEGGGAFSVS